MGCDGAKVAASAAAAEHIVALLEVPLRQLLFLRTDVIGLAQRTGLEIRDLLIAAPACPPSPIDEDGCHDQQGEAHHTADDTSCTAEIAMVLTFLNKTGA